MVGFGVLFWVFFSFCWILLVTRKLRVRLHNVQETAETFYEDLRTIIKTEEKKGEERSNTEALI